MQQDIIYSQRFKKMVKKNKKLKKVREQASCDETKCLEKNIGLINGDWLCLDCGEKVKPPAEERSLKPQAPSTTKKPQLNNRINK